MWKKIIWITLDDELFWKIFRLFEKGLAHEDMDDFKGNVQECQSLLNLNNFFHIELN